MKRFWMPINIGDYLAETGHLNVAEHGAYLLLLMHYWNHSGLPAEEHAICRISRMTSRQWLRSRDVLRALFGDRWRHPVMDLEIRKAIEKSEVNAANARKSHENRNRFAAQPRAHPPTQLHIQPDSLPLGESGPLSPKTVHNVENGKNRSANRLDPNWAPNVADEKVASDYGMAPTDIAGELAKFRAQHAEKGTMSHDWSATWLKWCARWDGKSKPINAALGSQATVTNSVHVKLDSPQWKAWQEHLKETTGKGSPSDKNFGWCFPSEWPPGYPVGQQTAAE